MSFTIPLTLLPKTATLADAVIASREFYNIPPDEERQRDGVYYFLWLGKNNFVAQVFRIGGDDGFWCYAAIGSGKIRDVRRISEKVSTNV